MSKGGSGMRGEFKQTENKEALHCEWEWMGEDVVDEKAEKERRGEEEMH